MQAWFCLSDSAVGGTNKGVSTMSGSGLLPLDADVLVAIYGASVADEAWPETLDRCTEMVGARCATLFSFDTLDPEAYAINAFARVLREGMTAEKLRHWMEHLAPLDREGHAGSLRFPAQRLLTIGEVWDMPIEQLRERSDYRFIEEHFGLGDKLFARLNDTPRYFDTLAFQFPAGVHEIPVSARQPFQALLPHLAKSVEMGQLFGQLRRRYRAVLAALDHVGLGLCVLDERGRLIVANTEAERILDAGHGLAKLASGALGCRDASDQSKLVSALTAATLSHQGERTRAEALLAVRRTPTAEPVLIEVSPLCDHLAELDGGGGEVLVRLIDIGNAENCSVAPFAAAYALSKAEAAVAALVIEGLTNPEIAETRGTTNNTVKSQVKSLMEKAGASSRVTLVRSILKADLPIARPPV